MAAAWVRCGECAWCASVFLGVLVSEGLCGVRVRCCWGAGAVEALGSCQGFGVRVGGLGNR